MEAATYNHQPVLLKETLGLLVPRAGETVLDVTLGLAGHSREFLKIIGADGMLIGLDADGENLEQAEQNLSGLPGKVKLHHCNFSELSDLALPQVDILFADLGMSSPHIDDPSRGFTFREDVPLDLRFDRTKGKSGANLIAQSSEQDLYQIFRKYGELKSARKLARAIKTAEVRTTGGLKKCTEDACSYKAASVLPQVFQALRIAVNDELWALEILLKTGPALLKPGGRMGVITFHSLEDRMVKQAFKKLSLAEKDPITGANSKEAPFEILTKKPIGPDEEESTENPRARSAKLRVILRRDSPENL